MATLQDRAWQLLEHPDANTVAAFDATPPAVQALLAETARNTADPRIRAICQRLMPLVDGYERSVREQLAGVYAGASGEQLRRQRLRLLAPQEAALRGQTALLKPDAAHS
ncbi:hypothetical protein [Megalodesulfovibrio paquesii]